MDAGVEQLPHGDQGERNAKARREIARAAGVALINATSALEEGATFDKGIDPMGIVMIALAARGRRVLRSAYRLIDVGERAEAAPLIRIILEYAIVTRWLSLDPEHNLTLWVKDDLRQRDVVRERLLADPGIDDGSKRLIEAEACVERAAASALLDSEMDDEGGEGSRERCPTCGRGGKRRKRLPALEQMAAHVGRHFAYDCPYRMVSQADIHATGSSVNNTLTRRVDGSIAIRSEPDWALSGYDSYEFGAFLLLDLVHPVAERWPDLGWGPVLDAVAGSLEAIKRAHPA